MSFFAIALNRVYEESPSPKTVKFTLLKDVDGKSLLSRNFHEFIIVYGASPSPVVAITKTTILVSGSLTI